MTLFHSLHEMPHDKNSSDEASCPDRHKRVNAHSFFSIPLELYLMFYFSRTIVFHPEGNALFSGSHDMLKIHQWEPGPRVCDAVSMGWGKIRDMAVSASQLVRCNSNFQSRLIFWTLKATQHKFENI